MRDAFRDHVIAEGIAAVDAIKETALAEPKSYIDAVLTVYKKYAKVVLDAFVSRVEQTLMSCPTRCSTNRAIS